MKFNRFILLTSLSLLILWILFSISRPIIGVEFASEEHKMIYKQFMFFAIPFLIISIFISTLKKSDIFKSLIMKIFSTLIILVFVLFFMIMSIFIDMCNWSNEEVLYKSKNGKQEIIIRNYGCGATDSGAPVVKIHKIQKFTKYFIQYSEIDTNNLNLNKWSKMNNNKQ